MKPTEKSDDPILDMLESFTRQFAMYHMLNASLRLGRDPVKEEMQPMMDKTLERTRAVVREVLSKDDGKEMTPFALYVEVLGALSRDLLSDLE